MSEESAFKNWINPQVIKLMAKEFAEVDPTFNQVSFIKKSSQLKELELKQRVRLVASQLETHLPTDYLEALALIEKVLDRQNLKSFALWPVSEYLGAKGLAHMEETLVVLKKLTPLFTSEFAIRPYLLQDSKKVLTILTQWTQDPNHHVRRWISEGTRPLLPWGEKIPEFINHPSLTLPLLSALRHDDELYVRKSVANHLNDISKHHPLLVIETLKAWIDSAPEEQEEKINWITRHALRTLIKKGHPKALKLIGVKEKAELEVLSFKLNKKTFKLPDTIELKLDLKSTTKQRQKIVVDYIIGFKKANGTIAPKVFKWKTFELEAFDTRVLTKKHSLKQITTMTFYKGPQTLAIQINGNLLYPAINWKLNL